MEDPRRVRLIREPDGIGVPNVVLECVFPYLRDPKDREGVSQVCRQWHAIDAITRKHVEIPFCYSILPSALTRRFKFLDSLKIKGKPRAYEFGLLPDRWGGYVKPWVNEIIRAYPAMSRLHFKRMEVTDEDLVTIARNLRNSLEVLKLDKCTGFSTLGLLEIARFCRLVKVIYLEESLIVDSGGEWLHELAHCNSRLEVLNFALTGLEILEIQDLEMLVNNCKSLSCLKLGEIDANGLGSILSRATGLKEFAMSDSDLDDSIDLHNSPEAITRKFDLPKGLNSLSGDILLPLNPAIASNIRKLDLKPTSLNAEGQVELLKSCSNLEFLEVRNIIGDAGVAVVAGNCRKLKRLRIERAIDDDHGIISIHSLVSLAQSCLNLTFLALHVADISNPALRDFGENLKHLVDFRLVLIESNAILTDLPLDDGILAVMKGCQKLTRICVYFRNCCLTDTGLAYIGRHGENLKWALLGCVGDSDMGLQQFALGCQKLEKLEIRDCPFGEAAICEAVITMKSLKYIWVEGCIGTEMCTGFKGMLRAYWNMEYFLGSYSQYGKQLLAYYSLAGVRDDRPEEIISLGPLSLDIFGSCSLGSCI